MHITISTKTMLRSVVAVLATSSAAAHSSHSHLRDEIQFEFSSARMPFKVSDIMANYMQGENGDEDGFIIITGGCNSLKGNERVNFGGDDLFACLSATNKTLKFDPFTETFEELAEAPHERQRHAGVVMNGELYVLGGRDADDNLVAAIDSFNPKTNTWTTRGELPEDVVTSDLTAWGWQNYIYVTGGFIADYTAVGTTYRLDVSNNPSDFESMGYTAVTSSSNPRGDIHAVELFGYAYMAGGLTHTSVWCEGLRTTERYHMASDTWEVLSDLNIGRADMAVALLNGKIIAIGGESKPENCKNASDPAYGSFPEDHVEVLLDPQSKNAKWIEFEEFEDDRFRFSAAVVPAQNRIYTFGGQLPYDFTCDCFPTSDDVGIGTEAFYEDSDDSLSAGAIAAIVIGSLAGAIIIFFIIRKCVTKRNKEALEAQSATELEAKQNGMVE